MVSVLMPVFNAERYVGQAIESILDQSYPNFEVVVVDDASTDNSWQVIRRLQDAHPHRVKAVRLKKNLNRGGDGAANVAFSKSHGEYIARMDADDIAHPDRLKLQVEFLEQHPDIDVVGSSVEVMNGQGDVVGQKVVPTTHQSIASSFFAVHPLIHPTVMMRRQCATSKTKLYRDDLNSNNDYLTFFTWLNQGKRFANLPDKLLKYRIHGQNDSLSKIKRTFRNTLTVRKIMLQEGFKPSIKNWFQLASQLAVISLLPEKVLFYVYLWLRGIYKPSEVLNEFFRNYTPLSWGRTS